MNTKPLVIQDNTTEQILREFLVDWHENKKCFKIAESLNKLGTGEYNLYDAFESIISNSTIVNGIGEEEKNTTNKNVSSAVKNTNHLRLKWKDVFNSKIKLIGLQEYLKIVFMTEYKFFVWGGRVYAVGIAADGTKYNKRDTGIFAEDLE